MAQALINELHINNNDRRHIALAALNRMNDLVGDSNIIQHLIKYFADPKIEKIFIASILRTSGDIGERVLLNELRTSKDFAIRVAICSVLSYRVSSFQKSLDIRLDKKNTYDIVNNSGKFFTFHGTYYKII